MRRVASFCLALALALAGPAHADAPMTEKDVRDAVAEAMSNAAYAFDFDRATKAVVAGAINFGFSPAAPNTVKNDYFSRYHDYFGYFTGDFSVTDIGYFKCDEVRSRFRKAASYLPKVERAFGKFKELLEREDSWTSQSRMKEAADRAHDIDELTDRIFDRFFSVWLNDRKWHAIYPEIHFAWDLPDALKPKLPDGATVKRESVAVIRIATSLGSWTAGHGPQPMSMGLYSGWDPKVFDPNDPVIELPERHPEVSLGIDVTIAQACLADPKVEVRAVLRLDYVKPGSNETLRAEAPIILQGEVLPNSDKDPND